MRKFPVVHAVDMGYQHETISETVVEVQACPEKTNEQMPEPWIWTEKMVFWNKGKKVTY